MKMDVISVCELPWNTQSSAAAACALAFLALDLRLAARADLRAAASPSLEDVTSPMPQRASRRDAGPAG